MVSKKSKQVIDLEKQNKDLSDYVELLNKNLIEASTTTQGWIAKWTTRGEVILSHERKIKQLEDTISKWMKHADEQKDNLGRLEQRLDALLYSMILHHREAKRLEYKAYKSGDSLALAANPPNEEVITKNVRYEWTKE